MKPDTSQIHCHAPLNNAQADQTKSELVCLDLNVTRRRSVFDPKAVQKQGYLQKQHWSMATGFSTHPLWFQKRYFWVRYDDFKYAKKPSKKVGSN